MNKNFFIGLALGIFVLVGGFVLFKNYNQSSYQVLIETNIPNTEITEGVSIMYTAIGFSPLGSYSKKRWQDYLDK